MHSLSRGQRARLAVGALLLDASATLPAAIAGAVSVFIREDLGMTDQRIGLALSASFLSGVLMVLLVRPIADTFGWRRLIVAAVLLATAGLLGAAFAVGPYTFTMALLLSGAGVALMMPATNLLLVTVDGRERLANMLAVKQASVPIAILLAGLAVPPMLLIADWRALFLVAVIVAPTGLLLVWGFHALASERGGTASDSDRWNRSDARASSTPPRAGYRMASTHGLSAVATGVSLTSMLPGALTAYLVISLVASGIEPAVAALIYGGSNIAGVTVRILAGLYATRVDSGGFVPVAMMMVLGGAGAMLLGGDSALLLVVGSSLAFGLGWGWPGLLFFAVMKARPDAPAGASAVVHAGGMFGAALGPMVVGAAAGAFGWTTAWLMVGLFAVLGGTLVLGASRRLVPPGAPGVAPSVRPAPG